MSVPHIAVRVWTLVFVATLFLCLAFGADRSFFLGVVVGSIGNIGYFFIESLTRASLSNDRKPE